MATHFVGYDLNQPGQHYARLSKALEECRAHWHCLDSTWLVVTDESADQLRDRLSRQIDENDALLVIDVTGDGRAWRGFDTNCSKWLENNF